MNTADEKTEKLKNIRLSLITPDIDRTEDVEVYSVPRKVIVSASVFQRLKYAADVVDRITEERTST